MINSNEIKTFINITTLKNNEVMLFSSNTQGRHGKGLAKLAMEFGAIYGQARGRQGNTYAIVTKDLTKPKTEQYQSVSLESIKKEIINFLRYANRHDDLTFYFYPIGTSLAGYTLTQIKNILLESCKVVGGLPRNIVLHRDFTLSGSNEFKLINVQTTLF
jgi:hypothetical protein